ncbi:MAG: (2Fe-2S)-binding protein [Aigarchaeota archaeon]|nr:(2Fe-2S)-binding protein [Aigarchaeota archaeon]MDW8092538.1 (2Fe-2S)-binding protein [Nitrososphaerota archaeon]
MSSSKVNIIRFVLNDEPVEVLVPPTEILLNTLRERVNVKSIRYGCGEGSCGACTVLVDGKPRLSCLTLTISVDGRDVTTVEGLSKDGELHPIQKAFIEHNAAQCGYCTPGFILLLKALLDRNPNPSRDEVIDSLSSNLCRCTGYKNILEAAMSVVRRR